MITWKKYIGCEMEFAVSKRPWYNPKEAKEIRLSRKAPLKGYISNLTGFDLRVCVYNEKGEFEGDESIFDIERVMPAIITKPARKLTMEEWELYCVNVLGIHLGSISVTGKGFAIKGYLLDGETIIPFDKEVDMLKVHKEEQG